MALTAWTGSAPVLIPEIKAGQIAGTVTDVSTSTNHLIQHIHILNTTAAVAYLQVFDAAASGVTLGTTAPTMSFGIPANGVLDFAPAVPIRLMTGFSIAGTTTRTGNTAAALDYVIGYAEKA